MELLIKPSLVYCNDYHSETCSACGEAISGPAAHRQRPTLDEVGRIVYYGPKVDYFHEECVDNDTA